MKTLETLNQESTANKVYEPNWVEPIAVDLEMAGQMVGVSAKTMKREIHRGELRGLKIGRQWRIRVAEIHAYLKRREASS